MASVVLREVALVYQLEQLVEQTAQPVEKVLETAVASYLYQLTVCRNSRGNAGVLGSASRIGRVVS